MKIEWEKMDVGCLPFCDLGFGIRNVADETDNYVCRIAGQVL